MDFAVNAMARVAKVEQGKEGVRSQLPPGHWSRSRNTTGALFPEGQNLSPWVDGFLLLCLAARPL
jgi:hypothetical protein